MNLTQSIKEQIILLASFSGREMNEMLLDGYMGAIADLDQESVLVALRDWLKTSKGFPHPSDIREKVMPEINAEDDAQDVANLIIAATVKDGRGNPERAKGRMGDLGWEVVRRMGGWTHLCGEIGPHNENTFRAQIRGYAETVIRKAKRGELDVAPALPAPQNDSVQSLISITMKRIE